MLTHLHIRDFAIVRRLELELAGGLSAITGETGAGKSIMVDALGLLLGERADPGVVRHGAERAEIAAGFDVSQQPEVRDWLGRHDLDAEDECQLRRLIPAQGRSRCYINGSLQPLTALRELGDLLVDIHGQHEHQSLLRRDAQRQLLDDHADNSRLSGELARSFQDWQQLRQTLERLERADAERDARLDLVRYQIDELGTLDPEADEVPRLNQELRRLANAERLIEGGQRLLRDLYEDDEQSVHARLSRLENELGSLSRIDPDLHASLQLLGSARIQIEEAGAGLRDHGAAIDLDPQRLREIEQRLDDYHRLARKHRCEPDQLATVQARLRHELSELDNSELRREQLAREVVDAQTHYRILAEQLRERRRAAADRLAGAVTETMQELGMSGGRFQIALEPLPEPTRHGLDQVSFLVGINPGQPLQVLAKTISGGELSRISLAIQVITAHSARIPTLIFDEVDTGIGGAVAEIVGLRLREVGRVRQVLCVTHLPQVAAQAHQQLRVEKNSGSGHTEVAIGVLSDEQRVTEIARMLGGLELTRKTLEHAREMINRANPH